MLMRLVIGACIFSLGYYIGRESALNDPDAGLAARKEDFLKGSFTDVDDEMDGKTEES